MYSNSKSNSAFNEINQSLKKVFEYLEKENSEQLGKELFSKLIMKYISQKTLIFFIINSLEEIIKEIPISKLPKYANLLSLFFENDLNSIPFGIYLSYLNPILSIIQSLINEKNINFLAKISEIYSKIVQNLMPDDIKAVNEQLNNEGKKIYEILQSFCLYNINFDKKINQIIGSLCLTKLVENCPYVLKREYMKKIIDNIMALISSENFEAKNELLNCLISLILGAENLFNPFAKLVFNTILDFLTNEDWIKRKLSLNIIYILSLYCKNEIITLKEHIINIIDVLKKDKVKEIRDICQLISQIYIQEEKEGKITKKRNKHLSSGNIINNNNRKGKINYIKYNNITSFSPYKTINNIKNKIHNLTTTKNFINFIKTPQRIKSQEKKRKSSFNSNSSLSDFNNKNTKFINKKKNFSFVNEKMVIKPDPNKSIFNTMKNMAFFRQNNKSDKKNKNLIIISNKEEDNDIKKNYNTFEGFYKEEKNNSIIEENIKKINKDYDNNKESINKLISLDAKIKKENIKKFEDKNIRDKNLIKSLLSEVNDLSNKQISLLDLMEEIQTNTQSQIEELNIKIFNLDNTIKELDEELYILQNNE